MNGLCEWKFNKKKCQFRRKFSKIRTRFSFLLSKKFSCEIPKEIEQKLKPQLCRLNTRGLKNADVYISGSRVQVALRRRKAKKSLFL